MSLISLTVTMHNHSSRHQCYNCSNNTELNCHQATYVIRSVKNTVSFSSCVIGFFFFFFQAEDGIRDYKVTGVQTCALPIWLALQTGAAVIVARCERLSWGRGYALYLEELPVPLSENLEAAVQQINEAMEQTIRQCPQQYLWGYARYKDRKSVV